MKKYSSWALALVFTIAGMSYFTLVARTATADRLLATGWKNHCRNGQIQHPEHWENFSPMGQIEVPGLGMMQPVLGKTSTESAAMGWSHVSGTALPGENGNIVLAGHQQSQAEFLSHVKPGDTVILHNDQGATTYQIIGSVVIKADNTSVLTQDGPDRLTLVTCFPFGGLTPADERYVLTGFRVSAAREPLAMLMAF